MRSVMGDMLLASVATIEPPDPVTKVIWIIIQQHKLGILGLGKPPTLRAASKYF